MRPIKFRAWHIGFRRMGFLDELWNNHWYSTPRGDAPDKGKIIFDNSNAWMGAHARSGKDIVIMQFTGFIDKDGREIYEGDILNDTYKRLLRIIWRDGRFQFEALRETNFLYADMYQWFDGLTENPEVIGNIYENPELLG